MNEPDRPQPEHRGFTWAGVLLAIVVLCYLIRFTILYPRPGLPFFFRYNLASMGIYLTAFAVARLFPSGSRASRALRVVQWAALGAAIIGMFQTPH